MKLSQLIGGLTYERMTGDAEITGLSADSRKVTAGCLFFCIDGGHCDSHAFAPQAEAAGAAAIVCERECEVGIPQVVVKNTRAAMSYLCAAFYGNPQQQMKIIGVTGTNGKTTVSYMIAGILGEWGKKSAVIGTLGAHLGGKAYECSLTTPDPITLYRLLAQLKEDGAEFVVMEVSAHALALNKVDPIFFQASVFTNLTHDHLDFFGSMEAYGRAKCRLFREEQTGVAVLNADDEFVRKLSRRIKNKLTYGLEAPADVFAVVEEQTAQGSRILINYDEELCDTQLNAVGKHNISNALAAVTVCRKLGADMDAVARGLTFFQGAEGRLEYILRYNGADIFVDYAHTPDGLEKVLTALKENCVGRLWCVFGCGGNRDSEKRPVMGEVAAKYCDFTVLTSDNPRYEEAVTILSEIEAGLRPHTTSYAVVEDRRKATEFAMKRLREGDILLVAGKGAECDQEIMGIKYRYKDKDVIEEIAGKV